MSEGHRDKEHTIVFKKNQGHANQFSIPKKKIIIYISKINIGGQCNDAGRIYDKKKNKIKKKVY